MGINTTVQPSVGMDSNLLILCGLASNMPTDFTATKISDLSKATVVDVTYALTSDGFKEGVKEDTVTDDRLSLLGVLAQPGRVTEDLTVRYVFGSANDVADPLLVPGANVVFAVRRAVPHNQALAAGDKFDYFPVKCGQKQNDAYAANAKFTRTQAMYPQALASRNVPLLAS
ncbi:phage tail tube protein [Curtobacterium citreum]